MSEPTKAQLQDDLTKTRARAQKFEQALAEVDSEARSYDRCVKALSTLKSNGRPDREAIRRVLDTLKARFGIEDRDQEGPGIDYFEPEIHQAEDPRDDFISMLVDALRKS